MNLVALELFANAVGPGKQVENIGRRFEIEEPQCFIAGNMSAAQNPLAEFGNFAVEVCVNQFGYHG